MFSATSRNRFVQACFLCIFSFLILDGCSHPSSISPSINAPSEPPQRALVQPVPPLAPVIMMPPVSVESGNQSVSNDPSQQIDSSSPIHPGHISRPPKVSVDEQRLATWPAVSKHYDSISEQREEVHSEMANLYMQNSQCPDSGPCRADTQNAIDNLEQRDIALSNQQLAIGTDYQNVTAPPTDPEGTP
jgi:hypothetical protein